MPDVFLQAAPPLGQRRLIVRLPRHVRSPRPIPHLNQVEAVVGIREGPRLIRRVRVSCHTETTNAVDLAQPSAHLVVPHAIVPVDHLPRGISQSKPVPGLGGDLLAQDHQQVLVHVSAKAACVSADAGTLVGQRLDRDPREDPRAEVGGATGRVAVTRAGTFLTVVRAHRRP